MRNGFARCSRMLCVNARRQTKRGDAENSSRRLKLKNRRLQPTVYVARLLLSSIRLADRLS